MTNIHVRKQRWSSCEWCNRGNRQTWKIHLFMIITVTLKPHHWIMARTDRITLHWHNVASSISIPPPIKFRKRRPPRSRQFDPKIHNYGPNSIPEEGVERSWRNNSGERESNRGSNWGREKARRVERYGIHAAVLPCELLCLSRTHTYNSIVMYVRANLRGTSTFSTPDPENRTLINI